jgi:hypothetical protein
MTDKLVMKKYDPVAKKHVESASLRSRREKRRSVSRFQPLVLIRLNLIRLDVGRDLVET